MINFEESAFADYLWWAGEDRKIFDKINPLINEILRDPFHGTGKPEPLKGIGRGTGPDVLLKNTDWFTKFIPIVLSLPPVNIITSNKCTLQLSKPALREHKQLFIVFACVDIGYRDTGPVA